MDSKKKNIVLITTWFPPIKGVAVNRMVAIAKYLDHEKYNLSVLTLRQNQEPERETLFDCNVERFNNSSILKTPVFNVSDSRFKHNLKVVWNLFLLKIKKDIYKRWRKRVVARLETLHSQNKIDLIISSFSPEAAHLAALEFCKKHPKVKWIADMRDEMSQNPTIDISLAEKYKRIEKEIDTYASAITTVSEPLVRLFQNTTMKEIGTVIEIRNGFDHEIAILPQPFNTCFTISYCGTFYGSHKPTVFLSVMETLLKEGRLPQNWKLLFVGTSRNFRVPEVLVRHIEFIEKVDQQMSLDYMMKSDANLFMVAKTTRVGVYTGKLFDYLSVKRPLLGILDKQDVAATLITQTGLGYLASNENPSEIAEAVVSLVTDWQNKKVVEVDHKTVYELHRKYQIQKLNLLIERLLNEN